LGTAILFSRTYSFLTGGNYLLHILLFYLVFIDEKRSGSGLRSQLSNMLSNFGIWACRLQVIIVYLFTGMYKLAGESWRSGEAVHIITHVDEFTLPWFEHSIADLHWLMVIANYSALIYFFSFPILVWSKRWKLYLLAFGAMFHLTLGLVIGVVDFSLIMIASYAAFLDDESIDKIKSILPGKKRSLAHH
ncbi:MAG: HTTM domain-containing protein, partial [Flavobacteriales bacterium]|nr:HTTM domain-containing protein [Flavobacteriales bacterium]